MAEAKKALEQATAFVRDKSLLTLPPRSNLQVIDTPEFMRGIYAVGGFNPAPPLQPELGAFYWITPIPTTWPKDRIESKLREYNRYGLQHLTIHEAMPGHYVQLEYANDVQPKSRRLLRNIFGNGPYIEGWAVYAQQLMVDQGYMSDTSGMRLTLGKQLLRVLANTILVAGRSGAHRDARSERAWRVARLGWSRPEIQPGRSVLAPTISNQPTA
jgi:uncharacterized protein (DUF885 family)